MEAYWYWLCHELYIERAWARELLKAYGSPENVFRASEEELLTRYPKKAARNLDILRRREQWEPQKAYEECLERGIWFYSCESREFPQALRTISDSPLGLFGKGSLPDPDRPSVAIVGARICSDYGKMTARLFGRDLAEHKVQVISGMAAGVDGYAQRGALEGKGKTFAVLGCGVDVCYPRQNRELYTALEKEGGILSEYPPGTAPLAHLFPLRNRIISGLSKAVLVVEAKEKSGSLITADVALEQGREVFAVPGRMGDALSAGCNRLIAQGAGIALSPEYLRTELGISTIKKEGKKEIAKNLLESSEFLVYSCLSLQSQHIEEIRKKTGLPLLEVMKILVSLELKGWVCEVQKNYYSKRDSS